MSLLILSTSMSLFLSSSFSLAISCVSNTSIANISSFIPFLTYSTFTSNPFSARYSGGDSSENNRKLLKELDGVPDNERTARFVSVICCILPDGREIMCRGECAGTILREAVGDGGFGYDPLFYYAPMKKTFAEMSPDEKNRVSHRARALEDFYNSFSKMLLIN